MTCSLSGSASLTDVVIFTDVNIAIFFVPVVAIASVISHVGPFGTGGVNVMLVTTCANLCVTITGLSSFTGLTGFCNRDTMSSDQMLQVRDTGRDAVPGHRQNVPVVDSDLTVRHKGQESRFVYGFPHARESGSDVIRERRVALCPIPHWRCRSCTIPVSDVEVERVLLTLSQPLPELKKQQEGGGQFSPLSASRKLCRRNTHLPDESMSCFFIIIQSTPFSSCEQPFRGASWSSPDANARLLR